MEFTSQTFVCNGQSIHAMTGGPKDAPVIVMLHGFPEYWKAWAGVAEHLLDTYRIVLPDQRGFNLSSKPDGVDAYHTRNMVADLVDLIEQIADDQTVVLCGHDWGASVAYAFAMRNPDKVSHLIIANGVHPMCFQKALYAGGPQTKASQYMNVLAANGSDIRMARDNFKPLLNMFQKFSATPWLDEEKTEEYLQAWSQDNALPSMLNWYRESPMVVPKTDAAPTEFPITSDMKRKYKISMPHLLIWGLDDPALLDEARDDLPEFCDDLTVHEISDASHWILHEEPEKVAKLINQFVAP